MIKHVVFYKLKDNTEESRNAVVEKFESMRGKIDVLRSIEAGKDKMGSGRSYDVCLICTFDSMEDLKAYADHPVHLPVKAYIGEVVERSVSVDFEE